MEPKTKLIGQAHFQITAYENNSSELPRKGNKTQVKRMISSFDSVTGGK